MRRRVPHRTHRGPGRLLAWTRTCLTRLALAASVAVAATNVSAEVRYEGDPVYSSRELDDALGIRSGEEPSPDILRVRLTELLRRYVADGYLDVEIEVRVAPGEPTVVHVDPGEHVVLGRRLTSGVPRDLAGEIDAHAELEPGDELSVRALERDLARTTEILAEEGYAFAESRVGNLARDGATVSFRLSVDAGERVVVDSLSVSGLEVTRLTTVERLAGFARGTRYRESARRRMRERLVRSGLFTRVGEVEIRTLPDGNGVYRLSVEEGPTTFITGILGVGGQDQELTGLLDVTLGNLFGTARTFRALWEGRGAGRVYYEIAYREPWILGLPVAIGGEFRQDQEDTLYTRTDWLADVEYAVLDRLTLRAGWQAEASTTPLELLTRTTRASTRFGLRWDGRDEIVNVRRGGLIDVTATQGTQKERFADRPRVEREVTTLETLGEAHVPVGAATGISASLVGYVRQSRGETLRPENLYPLGGAGSIRGYEERRFRTGLGAAAAIELRRFLDPVSGARVHLFVDIGYLDPARSLGTGGDAWKIGAGIGVRVPSRVGLLGIDLGASDEVRAVQEARVHVSVVGRY